MELGSVMKKNFDSYSMSGVDSISPRSSLQQTSNVKIQFSISSRNYFSSMRRNKKMKFYNGPSGPHTTFSPTLNHIMICWNREYKQLELAGYHCRSHEQARHVRLSFFLCWGLQSWMQGSR